MARQKLGSMAAFLVSFLIGVGVTGTLVGTRHSLSLLQSMPPAHSARVAAVAASPGGKYLASGDVNGHLSVRRVNGEPAWDHEFDSAVLAVAFSKSGYRVAVLTRGGEVACFETLTGRLVSSERPLPQSVFEGGTLGYVSKCEPTLMIYGHDALRQWLETQGRDGTLHPFDSTATCIAWSPEAGRFVSGNESGRLKLFDRETYGELADRQTGLGRLQAAAISKDGRLTAASGTGGVVVFRGGGEEPLVRVAPEQIGDVSALSFSADGKRLVVGDSNGGLSVWAIK